MGDGLGNDEVFGGYSKKFVGLPQYQEERDRLLYDMSQRLRLADIIVRDGHKTVVDLGSQLGGMSYALKEAGVKRAVSTEFLREYCTDYLKKLDNCNVVHCDSFQLPIKNADALVSYMFLGRFLPKQLDKKRRINDVFLELSKSADTIYGVELQSEYSNWFSGRTLNPERILRELEGALPDFDVAHLGNFGAYQEWPDDEPEQKRLGFKFTKKEETRDGR